MLELYHPSWYYDMVPIFPDREIVLVDVVVVVVVVVPVVGPA